VITLRKIKKEVEREKIKEKRVLEERIRGLED
jgi:hypothetical protein